MYDLKNKQEQEQKDSNFMFFHVHLKHIDWIELFVYNDWLKPVMMMWQSLIGCLCLHYDGALFDWNEKCVQQTAVL